jgi:hypothetical protein
VNRALSAYVQAVAKQDLGRRVLHCPVCDLVRPFTGAADAERAGWAPSIAGGARVWMCRSCKDAATRATSAPSDPKVRPPRYQLPEALAVSARKTADALPTVRRLHESDPKRAEAYVAQIVEAAGRCKTGKAWRGLAAEFGVGGKARGRRKGGRTAPGR